MRRAAAILVVSLVALIASGESGRPTTDLNLRAAPTARKSNVISVLGPSDEFEILETRQGWCRVRLVKTGVEGWVAQRFVRVTPDEPQRMASAINDSSAEEPSPTGSKVALLAGVLAVIGYVTGFKPRSSVNKSQWNRSTNRLAALILSLALGALYVVLTLPKLLIAIGMARGWMTVSRLGEWSLGFNQKLSDSFPAFPALLQATLWAIAFYLLSLLILAIRHGALPLFRVGAVTLVCSIACLHILCWAGYVVVKVLTVVFWLIGAIVGVVADIFRAVFSFLAQLAVGLAMWIYSVLHDLLGQFWWLVPVGVVIVLGALLVRSRGDWIAILKVASGLLLVTAAIGVVIYVMRWLWSLIAAWVLPVLKFLATLIVFLGNMVLRLLLGLGILFAAAIIGQLLIDQIQSALAAGRRRRGVVIGALAIGAAIAILLVVSNAYSATSWLPSAAMAVADKYLHQPTPLLDALIAFGIVALSIVGVWRNMPALGEEPTMQEFNKSLVYSFAGVLVAGGLVALGGAQGDE